MIDRRSFLQTTIAGTAGLAVTGPALRCTGRRRRPRRGDRANRPAPRRDREDAPRLDRAAVDRRRKPGLSRRARSTWRAWRATQGSSASTIIPTKGKPGVFATLDAGADTTLGVYFMYDVKQFDPAEWSSPPLEGRLVDRPGLGSVMVGRGATNTKGPQMAFLAALHAFKAAGQPPTRQHRPRLRGRGGDRLAQLLARSSSSPRWRRR